MINTNNIIDILSLVSRSFPLLEVSYNLYTAFYQTVSYIFVQDYLHLCYCFTALNTLQVLAVIVDQVDETRTSPITFPVILSLIVAI